MSHVCGGTWLRNNVEIAIVYDLDQAYLVLDSQFVVWSSLTFPLGQIGLSPTPDRDRHWY
jgi:hypothetical protein